jgi:hypothetical protein
MSAIMTPMLPWVLGTRPASGQGPGNGGTVSDNKSLKVSTEVYGRLGQFKIKLAGSIGHIPTMNDIISSLLDSGDKHYDEIVGVIKDN